MKVKLGNFYFKQAEIKIGSETIIGSEWKYMLLIKIDNSLSLNKHVKDLSKKGQSKIAGTNLGFFVYVSLYRCIGYTDEWIF